MPNFIFEKIRNNYGSKQGLLKRVQYSLILRLGGFYRYQNVDFTKVHRLVFICSGNICRSPLAEVVATHSGVTAVSYGLHCSGGHSADPRAIAYAEKHGFNLHNHRTKNINEYTPAPGDLLVGMEPQHARDLEQLFAAAIKVTLAGLWLAEMTAYIHDPYSTNPFFFSRCENQIVEATGAMVSKLSQETTDLSQPL